MENSDIMKLLALFCPYEFEKREQFKADQGKFVHYTSASVAKSIFENKEVWMREASTMNDFMEIEHGLRCITEVYNKKDSDIRERFKTLLDSVQQGTHEKFEKLFNSWIPSFKENTYITCISEHSDSENITGRLSMWRAYGGDTSVALVMKNDIFYSESDYLKAYSSPVAYLHEDQFAVYFEKIVSSLEQEKELLKRIGEDSLVSIAFQALRMNMLCLKHPGFHEEKEWRVIYCPKLEKSNVIKPSIEIVRGVPQIIQKIPLDNNGRQDLYGLELSELIDRVIIGPTEHPRVIREAFIELMTNAGISDAKKKVWVSDIPLRIDS